MNINYAENAKKPPLMSVVLPAYNHAGYLIEAIESVRAQTFTDWELIVIDDGSTDNSWELLQAAVRQWNDPRIQTLLQANAGSHATINRGLVMAHGTYLAILNSDDRFHSERLQRLVTFAQSAGDEVFITTGLRLIDQTGATVNRSHWWNTMYNDLIQHWRMAQQASGHPAVDALLWGNFTVTTSNFFFSRTLWERVGHFRHVRYVPDWDYALRVAGEVPQAFHFLPDQNLLDYRLHGRNTILGGALRNHAEAYRVLRTFLRRWVQAGHSVPAHAIDRIHYLGRFMRHEHARLLLEQQQSNWEAQRKHWHEQIEHWQKQSKHWEQQSEHWKKQVQELRLSRSWRMTAPLREFVNLLRQVRRLPARLAFKARGYLSRVREKSRPPAYEQWLMQESLQLASLRVDLGQALQALEGRRPLVSVIMPVHDTEPAYLRAAIESVQAQWYPDWELCICDDASRRNDTRELLNAMAAADMRIRIVRRTESGHIVKASNDAIALARGEFVVFLDHDDLLAPQALLRLMQECARRPELDILYSDEDKLDAHGQRCLPLFKPDWSPALAWSQNYVGHIMCVRRTLLEQIGGLREGCQGSQDHDLVLRLAAAGARFGHVAEVLYHWRVHDNSTSANPESKPYAHHAGKEAVAHHLAQRYGPQFDRVEDGEHPFVYAPRFHLPAECFVSIIVPTRDKSELLQACIDSIRNKTVGIHYEIIVLDNGSVEAGTHACFEKLVSDSRIHVVAADIPFNWSRLNNIGRSHARGQVLVFLNNDTLVISPDWLQRLAEYALLPDVATVGAMLLYPDDTIQHAGVVVGMGGWADHVFKAEPVRHFPSPYISSVVPRNVLASTGACVAVSASAFDRLGGFDEAFEICGSDVELGIRGHKQGYQNIYLPAVRLYHLESKTRSPHVPAVDFEQSSLKYAPYRLQGDPFFNPNLDSFCSSPTPRFPSNAPA